MPKPTIKINTFHNQPNDDSILYRYVTIDKLLDFLFSARIPLVKLKEFEDKLEGVNVKHLLLNFTSNQLSKDTADWLGGIFKQIVINVNPTKRNSLRRQREIFQDINYASCWYISNHESVAMWQLYSNPNSVAIRIPFKNLSNEILNFNFELPPHDFNHLRFGCIDYHRFDDLDELSKIIVKEDSQGFIKDSSFQHEQEFRILVETKLIERKTIERKETMLDEQIEKLNNGNFYKVIHLTLANFKSMPFEIVFHPKSHDWHRNNIRKIIEKFELQFKTSESKLKDIFN